MVANNKMSIEKAKQIEGFMTEIELEILARIALNAKVIIEVGSWYGRSTRALGDNTNGIVYAIDHWNGSKGEDEAHKDAKKIGGDYAFVGFYDNNFDLIENRKIIPLRMNARNALFFLQEKRIKADLIFIDGGHLYEEVKQDILNCLPLLAENGVICGHDYHESWPGVMKAVQELFTDFEVEPATSIWFKKYK